MAKCNGAHVALQRADACDEAAFRTEVQRVCSAKHSAAGFLCVSYSRKQLHQSGDGHFSPVGGYHAARDMVLVMDVARPNPNHNYVFIIATIHPPLPIPCHSTPAPSATVWAEVLVGVQVGGTQVGRLYLLVRASTLQLA